MQPVSHIVAVQTGLGPDSVMGGAVSDREFLVRLADRGFKVHLLLPAGLPHATHPNFDVHYYRNRLRHIPYFRYVLRDVDVFFDLKKLLPALPKTDWIRFSSPYRNGLGTWAANQGRRKLWGSFHHFEDHYYFNRIDRWLPRKCDLVTVVSQASRDDLLRRCPRIDSRKIAVIHNGVDAERFCPDSGKRQQVRQELGVAAGEVLIVFTGRLIARKGIPELLEVWQRVACLPRAKLLIVGTPSVQDFQLSQRVKELAGSDGRVTYRERVADLPAFLGAGDIFFFPTRLEGFGLVVAEALACGLPVVTTRAHGVSEVVDASCSLQAAVGDVAELAALLSRLIGDASLRACMGAAGRERMKALFTWESQVSRLMGCLNSK